MGAMGDSKESNMASMFIFCAKGTFPTRIAVFCLEKFPGEDFLRNFLKNYPLDFSLSDFIWQNRLVMPEKM